MTAFKGIVCICGDKIKTGTLLRHYQLKHPRVNINGIMKPNIIAKRKV